LHSICTSRRCSSKALFKIAMARSGLDVSAFGPCNEDAIQTSAIRRHPRYWCGDRGYLI
jgi:hypothetical protein